jgi:hypothetical protein
MNTLEVEALNKIIENKKKVELKRLLLKEINDFFRLDILKYLESLLQSNNCSKCKNWNYGRMYWICIKGYSIRRDCHNELPYTIYERALIPFMDTMANHGCKDYEYDRNRGDYKKLVKVDGHE